MAVRRVYIHGAGRRGAAAWPHASDAGGDDFISFPAAHAVAEQAELLAAQYGGERLLVFAHSIGAVPAVLAAHRLDLAGLVLVEPALYDIARGEASIERHIGIVGESRAQADAGNLRGFWAMLRPLMFGGPLVEADWDRERPIAEHWATTNLPWGHGVRAHMLHGIPTLVITGGWNDEYETIAGVLAAGGAQHLVLTGAAHRAQDASGFDSAVADFELSLGIRPWRTSNSASASVCRITDGWAARRRVATATRRWGTRGSVIRNAGGQDAAPASVCRITDG